MCKFADTNQKPAVENLPSRLRGAALEDWLRQSQPVILLGMHRSGTSLTTRLLADLGLHMGAWLSKDAEAVYFQRLNRRVFRSAGADWANIQRLLQAMKSTEFQQLQFQKLMRSLLDRRVYSGFRPGIATFFGPQKWSLLLKDVPFIWGWKDPRSTLLFPLWSQIFPAARFVHVIRNGIDVAISTHRRSLKQQKKFRNRILPVDYKPITLDFDYCFNLWAAYLDFVFEHKHLIPDEQYLEIRYEKLLADPDTQMHRLLDYLKYPAKEEQIARVCSQINRARLDNSGNARPYEKQFGKLTQHVLMQRLGYA